MPQFKEGDNPEARTYLPELDGLRFFAFFLVYLFHNGIPQFVGWVNSAVDSVSSTRTGPRENFGETIRGNGWVGVQLFFILSGYLIASLLLREEARFGRIDLRAFWIRRILRIWPLYFLIVAIGFTLLPWSAGMPWSDYRTMVAKQIPAFALFLGNWSMGLFGPVPFDATTILWSVCVEEQFYVLCPLLIAWTRPRYRIPLVIALMAVALVGRWWTAVALIRGDVGPLFFSFSTLTQLDTLLSGVLLALILTRWPPGRRASRVAGWLQWPLALAALWLLTRPGLAHETVARMTWGFVAIWLVGLGTIAVAEVRDGWLRAGLSYSRLVWLGKISYGLYMYHEIAILLGMRSRDILPWFPNQEILTTIGTFAATISLAATSYYLFERPFLRRKMAWSRVPSRPI